MSPKPSRQSLSWLSNVGDYDILVNHLACGDPRLRRRDLKSELSQEIPWQTASAMAVVLHTRSGQSFQSPEVHRTAPSLADCLTSEGSSSDPDGRRLIIMQGLNPAFVGAVGSHFKMHPSFFIDHERVTVTAHNSKATESSGPILPGTMSQREHIMLKYYEPIEMPAPLMGLFNLTCADTGRHLGATRIAGVYSEVGVLRRKCCIWSRPREGGRGWDVVVITDPPMARARRPPHGEVVKVGPVVPMQGGYIDFIPHHLQSRTHRGPPRTSMLDDMCFYLDAYPHVLDIQSPEDIKLLALKIVASHYMQHSDYLKMVISNTQWNISKHGSSGTYSPSAVESQWWDVLAIDRRMCEYCQDLEWLMLQCRIPLCLPAVTDCTTWKDFCADFQFIYMLYVDLRNRSNSLNSSITALAGMAGNQHALRETKSTKALTVVGLTFIPLAYVSSLFSMSDDYMPGGSRFWIYFAVSFPLIALVFGVYVLVDLVLYGSIPFLRKFGRSG